MKTKSSNNAVNQPNNQLTGELIATKPYYLIIQDYISNSTVFSSFQFVRLLNLLSINKSPP